MTKRCPGLDEMVGLATVKSRINTLIARIKTDPGNASGAEGVDALRPRIATDDASAARQIMKAAGS